VIGAVKYDPEAKKEEDAVNAQKRSGLMKWLYRFKLFRYLVRPHKAKSASYPTTVAKSEETNIEKIYNKLVSHDPPYTFYTTEKMEGMAGAWMLTGKKRKYAVFSHNMARDPKGVGVWESVGRMYNLESILREQKHNLCIQGEICGPNIQRNIYGFNTLKLFVYKITDTDTGIPFNCYAMRLFCREYGLTFVSVICPECQLPESLDAVLEDADGMSVYGDNVLREGLVWRTIDQSVGFKAKSRKYAMWFGKEDKTE
jgi:hypothetical protein